MCVCVCVRVCCSQDPTCDKALEGIDLLQKLNSSEVETPHGGGGSEDEDEGEDILVARGLEVHTLEVIRELNSFDVCSSLTPTC